MQNLFHIPSATTLMQYLIGALMALLPAIIWGYIFYKKSPENRKIVIISFIAGIFSVVPMFVWQYNWDISFSFLHIEIPHLNIYSYIKTLTAEPTLGNFLVFSIITMIVSFIIYISTAVIIFIIDLFCGKKLKEAWKNIFQRSFEEPFIFISIGILIALFVSISSSVLSLFLSPESTKTAVYAIFWSSVMVGFLEEFSKHLVVRFSDDNVIYSIDSAIEFSVIVALGFAFLENIIYFIDKLWLAPCNAIEIANNECLFSPLSGRYQHQAGIMLIPFIFRSILSTLAHLVFSGIFGYFYGIAHFASYELKDAEHEKWSSKFWIFLHHIFRFRTSFVFHEVKILQGLLFAMLFHGFFNFLLDQEITYLTVPLIFLGYLYVTYLFQKKENQKKLRLISDTRTSSKEVLQKAKENIELLEKIEESYEGKLSGKSKMEEIEERVELLEDYEKMVEKKNSS